MQYITDTFFARGIIIISPGSEDVACPECATEEEPLRLHHPAVAVEHVHALRRLFALAFPLVSSRLSRCTGRVAVSHRLQEVKMRA